MENEDDLTSPSEAPGSTAGFSNEYVENPLAGDDVPEPGPPIDGVPSPEGPKDTARIGAKALNFGCTMVFGMPLEAEERSAFEYDLAAVLAKHDVPNLPYAEEMQLATTTVEIVGKRILIKRAIEQQAAEAAAGNDAAAPAPPSSGGPVTKPPVTTPAGGFGDITRGKSEGLDLLG